MRRLLIVLLFCVSGSVWSEECHVIVKKDALLKQVVEGQEMFVVAVEDVKPNQCFKPVETAQHIKKLQQQIDDNLQLAEAYKQNQEALQKLNQDYQQLIQRHEQTLDKSINVSENFEKNVENYNQLAKDYDQLTVKFDDLAGKYRDVALTSGSPISVELGAGLTDQGDGIALLGAGFNVYKTWDVKAWGLMHKDFFGFLGGASFRF
ncbi:MAG: hypothetical protein AMJ53_02105 [Gammaproteobacteria bacterium SG8_11]|nr:MAG: hypothetical protein AMJ53_02105 [Gammaproteobacteria bacterium SG8_11]